MILTPFVERRLIYGGVDLASTTDITAWAMVQKQENQGWICNWRFWIPQDGAEQAERRDGVPYKQWEEAGFLEFTPGGRLDHEWVKTKILEDCLEHDIGMVGFDPWNTEWIQSSLEYDGIEAIAVRQGYASLSEPCKHLEASIAEGTFRHGNNPVSNWMAENIEVETDVGGNIRPVKPKHGSTKRIDGIVATITAMAVAIVSPDDDVSAYDEPGGLGL